jgi:murein DD-endopeptidase MepM/ murein hydrolase activator NlpD
MQRLSNATVLLTGTTRLRFLLAGLVCIATSSCSIPRWPVEGPMTSPYGVRLRGVLPEIHRGVDVYVPEGTPVLAMKDGDVVFAGAWGSYGLAIVVQHGGGVRSLYAHLSTVEVSAGQRISGRDVIGRSGSTGNATGPHLHFEVLRDGFAVDPVPLLGGFPAKRRVRRGRRATQ